MLILDQVRLKIRFRVHRAGAIKIRTPLPIISFNIKYLSLSWPYLSLLARQILEIKITTTTSFPQVNHHFLIMGVCSSDCALCSGCDNTSISPPIHTQTLILMTNPVAILNVIITQPFLSYLWVVRREICRKLGFYISSYFNLYFPSCICHI